MLVVEALANGYVLAFNLAILANLTRCMAKATVGKIDPHQNGSLWVFQLWMQVYFSKLRPEVPSFNSSDAMGLELASCPVPTHFAEEIFKHFFGLEDLSDNEFQIAHRQTYLSFTIHP